MLYIGIVTMCWEHQLILRFRIYVKKIISFIHKDLKSQYHRCKLLNDVDKFKETFLVGNALGQIVNHELILFKPP